MKIEFKWIGGATFILSIDNIKIAVDPVLCKKGTVQDYFWFKSKRIENPSFEAKDFKNIDLWLITHNHEDHLDNDGLKVIQKDALVITNRNSYKKLSKNGNSNTSILTWKEVKKLNIKGLEISIEAIKAIHGINPMSAYFAGKVNGYYLTLKKGSQEYCIYITSDTVYKTKIINTFANKKIDLLIPNMGAAKKGTWIMTLTLDSQMLKKMIDKLNPKLVIPVHYGTFEHYNEPVSEIIKLKENRIKIMTLGQQTKIQ